MFNTYWLLHRKQNDQGRKAAIKTTNERIEGPIKQCAETRCGDILKEAEGGSKTIVDLIKEKWHLTLLTYIIFFTMLYFDSRDGYISSHGENEADTFLMLVIPIFIISLIPYLALVYFYPRYISKVKEEIINESLVKSSNDNESD